MESRTAELQEPWAYGDIERAIGEVLGADPETQAGALRGRLKHLSGLGILGQSGPGKGARRRYSRDEANKLLVAMLVEDCGLDPIVVVKAVNNTWPKLERNVRQAMDDEALSGNPMLLTLRLEQIGGPWRTKDPLAAVPWIGVNRRIDTRAKTMYQKRGFKDESDLLVSLFDRDEPGWLAVRNLTAAMSLLYRAIRSGGKAA